MNLIQMSISGACIIFVTVVIRALAIHRLPKRTFLTLWGIAFARLLIPFSIPSSFGMYALLSRSTPAARIETVPIFPQNPGAVYEGNFAAIEVPTPKASFPVWTVIWLIGVGICALLFALSYIRWHKVFRRSAPVDNALTQDWLKAHSLRRTIAIRQSGCISAPLTYGILHPVILVPEGMNWEDSEALNYVFAHEFTHIRRFDALIKLALAITPCVHWFNPLVWAMYVLANRDIELTCDEAVIRSSGVNSKKSYALTLLDLEEKRSGLIVLTNGFSRNAIEERIRAIMKMKKTTLPAILLAVILVIGMATAFATSAPADGGTIQKPGSSADYSIYAPYGLLYDAKNDCYTYNGSVVAFFNDPVAHASFTNYFTGTIELEAVYDENNVLIGITECSQEVYDRHAEKRRRFGTVSESSDLAEEAVQTGKQSDPASQLEEYALFGIAYDENQGYWCSHGKKIKILVDLEAANVYLSDDGTICLVVLRTEDGRIYGVDKCTEEQARSLMQTLNPQSGGLTVEAASEFSLDEATMSETAIRRLVERYPEIEEWIREQYPDTTWWTVEGYNSWMMRQLELSNSMLGQTIGWNSSGAVVVTQESIAQQMAEAQETLRLLADGWMISKSIEGNENLGVGFNPADWADGRGKAYELSVLLKDGSEAHFGPYDTTDELLREFLPFSEAQVAAGNLDQSEVDEIIEFYTG